MGQVPVLAAAIERDQRAERVRHRLARVRDRRFQVLDDRLDAAAVRASDAVHLFDDAAVAFDNAGVEGVSLFDALEILHRHADIQIVRARGEDVLPCRRTLRRDLRVEIGIEEHRFEADEHLMDALATRDRDAFNCIIIPTHFAGDNLAVLADPHAMALSVPVFDIDRRVFACELAEVLFCTLSQESPVELDQWLVSLGPR